MGSYRDSSCPLCGLLMQAGGRRHLETHLLFQSHQVCSQMNDVNSNPVWAQTERQKRDGKMPQGIKAQSVPLCCHKQQCRPCPVHPCIRKQIPNSPKLREINSFRCCWCWHWQKLLPLQNAEEDPRTGTSNLSCQPGKLPGEMPRI